MRIIAVHVRPWLAPRKSEEKTHRGPTALATRRGSENDHPARRCPRRTRDGDALRGRGGPRARPREGGYTPWTARTGRGTRSCRRTIPARTRRPALSSDASLLSCSVAPIIAVTRSCDDELGLRRRAATRAPPSARTTTTPLRTPRAEAARVLEARLHCGASSPRKGKGFRLFHNRRLDVDHRR